MAYTTTPQDNETIANLPGDIRAVTTLVTNHTEAASAAHAASAISYGAGSVQTALDTAAGHEADQNNPHNVTAAQAGAVALADAVTTVTAGKIVRRDSLGKIAGDITGNAATANLATSNGVPSGVIAMWSGAASSIPSGWVLCDGNNNAPNLMDKFIVGAGASYAVGTTGGKETHVLSIAELPPHNFTVTLNGFGGNVNSWNVGWGADQLNDGPTVVKYKFCW